MVEFLVYLIAWGVVPRIMLLLHLAVVLLIVVAS